MRRAAQPRLLAAAALAAAALAAAAWAPTRVAADGNAQLEAIMDEMERMTIELRDEVEKQYARRCALSANSCKEAAYEGCVTSYTDQAECSADYIKIGECGSCGAVFDFTTSNVRIPKAYMSNGPGSSPDTPSLKETVCYTNAITDFMVRQAEEVKAGSVFQEIPQTYFGAHNGLFRFYPARQTGVCGGYDPRVRPWFTAASSGPKDVVLVLDISGSMHFQNRWSLAKQAAIAVLNSLSIADHFGVVLFSTDAKMLSGSSRRSRMQLATEENVKNAIDALERVTVGGSTNFLAAFRLAFDVLDHSVEQESTSRCHTAVLFLTDGEMTYPEDANVEDVYDLVLSRNAEHGATLFTYSLGNGADRVVPKNLACSTGGIWSPIPDGDNLAAYMSAYYKLFAIGLGGEENKDFVAWVEPYLYESGEDYGTTTSAPVYDRSVSPPIWLGVVGVDFTVGAMTRVVGGSDAYSVVLQKLVDTSVARCPALTDTDLPCLIESLRREVGAESSCNTDNCATSMRTEPETCGGDEHYPVNLWVNQDFKDVGFHAIKPYKERTCCGLGKEEDAEFGGGAGTCGRLEAAGISDTVVYVVAAVGVVVVCITIYSLMTRSRRKRREAVAQAGAGPPQQQVQPGFYPSTSAPAAPTNVQMSHLAPAPTVYLGAGASQTQGVTYVPAPAVASDQPYGTEPVVAVPVAQMPDPSQTYAASAPMKPEYQ